MIHGPYIYAEEEAIKVFQREGGLQDEKERADPAVHLKCREDPDHSAH